MLKKILSVTIACIFLINAVVFGFAANSKTTSKTTNSKNKQKITTNISKKQSSKSVTSQKPVNKPSTTTKPSTTLSKTSSNKTTSNKQNTVSTPAPKQSVNPQTQKPIASNPSVIPLDIQKKYQQMKDLFADILKTACDILNASDIDKQNQLIKNTKYYEKIDMFKKLFPEIQKIPQYKSEAEYCRREIQRMNEEVQKSMKKNIERKKQEELKKQQQQQLQQQEEEKAFLSLYDQFKSYVNEANQVLDIIEQEQDPYKQENMFVNLKEGKKLNTAVEMMNIVMNVMREKKQYEKYKTEIEIARQQVYDRIDKIKKDIEQKKQQRSNQP